jgi:SAM-dependent methyltransferase
VGTSGGDSVFNAGVADYYQTYLVPMLFAPYATALVRRLVAIAPTRILEVAAGTGVVTRVMATAFPDSVAIVATDLNQAMLDRAMAVGTSRPVEWHQADALRLPFGDGQFDVVACQFGAMFFPDKVKAFGEARRVLRPGGVFIFSVWDRIEDNEFAETVTAAVASLFPGDPPFFLRRTPHGYFDPRVIARDLLQSGFVTPPEVETLAERSRAATADIPAIAYCHGTPLRQEIEARDALRLGEATSRATDAIADRFGPGPVDGKMQAHIVSITR